MQQTQKETHHSLNLYKARQLESGPMSLSMLEKYREAIGNNPWTTYSFEKKIALGAKDELI